MNIKKLQHIFSLETIKTAWDVPVEDFIEVNKMIEKFDQDYYCLDLVRDKICESNKKLNKMYKILLHNDFDFIMTLDSTVEAIADYRIKEYKKRKALERKEQRNANKNKCK